MESIVPTRTIYEVPPNSSWRWFKYRDLDYNEFRLLDIRPGQPGHDIRCTLRHCKLPDRDIFDEYEAISYTWGSPEDKIVIECSYEGMDGPTYIKVTRNCADAIQRLRYHTGTRVIWIDALCINQEDEVERSQQVLQMRLIYSKAECVVAYLSRRETVSGGHSPVFNLNETEVLDLFHHRYFTRVWIIQEILFARNVLVYYGDMEISWDEMKELYINASPDPQYLNFLAAKFTVFIRDSRNWKLLEVMRATKNYEATDPRDKLIALLSIAKDVDPVMEFLLVDYTVPHLDTLLERLAILYTFRHFSNANIPNAKFGRRQACPRFEYPSPNYEIDELAILFRVCTSRRSRSLMGVLDSTNETHKSYPWSMIRYFQLLQMAGTTLSKGLLLATKPSLYRMGSLTKWLASVPSWLKAIPARISVYIFSSFGLPIQDTIVEVSRPIPLQRICDVMETYYWAITMLPLDEEVKSRHAQDDARIHPETAGSALQSQFRIALIQSDNMPRIYLAPVNTRVGDYLDYLDCIKLAEESLPVVPLKTKWWRTRLVKNWALFLSCYFYYFLLYLLFHFSFSSVSFSFPFIFYPFSSFSFTLLSMSFVLFLFPFPFSAFIIFFFLTHIFFIFYSILGVLYIGNKILLRI